MSSTLTARAFPPPVVAGGGAVRMLERNLLVYRRIWPVIISGFFEPFSSISHLCGAALFACLSIVLLRRGRGSRARVVSLAVFSFGAVFLLSMSGVYHLLTPGDARLVLRRLDHAAIFLLIACSFTPAHTILFRGHGRWGILLLVWTIAVVGITIKTIFFDEFPVRLGLAIYIAMGWIGLYTGVALWRRFGFNFMQPILWGGLAYTVGGVLESLRWPIVIPGVVQWHEIFHVAVLIGLAFHWAFNYAIADGRVDLVGAELV